MADDGRYGGRIGTRTAYALLLHRAYERGLGVAAGRLGEALLLIQLFAPGALALGQVGYALDRRGALVVLGVLIDRGIAREHKLGIAGAEAVSGAAGVHGDVVVHGVGHLAGGEPAPDEPVEHVLLARQVVAHHLGRQRGIGRAYGLVRVLRACASLVAPGLGGAVRLAVVVGYKAARGGERLLAETQRVGAHVGYEADGALAGDVHALVKLLGYAHRAARGHAQAAAGLLLQRAGDEGRRGAALLLAALHGVYRKRVVLYVGYDAVDLLLAFDVDLFLALAVVARGELAAVVAQQRGVEQPVLLGHKGAYLLFAVDHHARGHALHAAGAEAAADLLPQQRTQLVTHDAVEDAPRLLGVHQVYIYFARRLDALRDHFLRYLVEGHAHGLVVGQAEQLLQMPGDGLSLAVRVGREVDDVRLFRALFELGDDVLLALDRDIVRLEAVFYVHAHRALGQVTQVTHAGEDLEVLAQIFLYGSCFRRRLDDNERRLSFRH